MSEERKYCYQSDVSCVIQSLAGFLPQVMVFIFGIRYYIIFRKNQSQIQPLKVKSRIISPLLCVVSAVFTLVGFFILVSALKGTYQSILNTYVMMSGAILWCVLGYWIYHFHLYKISSFYSAPRLNIFFNTICQCTFTILSFGDVFKMPSSDGEDSDDKHDNQTYRIMMIVFLFLTLLSSFLTNVLLCFEIDIEDQNNLKKHLLTNSEFSSSSIDGDQPRQSLDLKNEGLQSQDSRFTEGQSTETKNVLTSSAPKKAQDQIKIQGFQEIDRYNKKTIVYIIIYLPYKGNKVQILRSYREFNQLYLHLKQFYKSLSIPEFPKKSTTHTQLSMSELQKRSVHLEQLLKFVINNKIFDKIVCLFLDPEIKDFVQYIIQKQKSQAQQNANQIAIPSDNSNTYSKPKEFTVISERPSADEESVIQSNIYMQNISHLHFSRSNLTDDSSQAQMFSDICKSDLSKDHLEFNHYRNSDTNHFLQDSDQETLKNCNTEPN